MLKSKHIFTAILFLFALYIPALGEGTASLNGGNGARSFIFGLGASFGESDVFKDVSVFSNPRTGLYPDSDYRYIYVYAKPGETINIGTSFTENDIDISFYSPNGTVQAFDVMPSSQGHIANYLQERNGPKTICRLADCSSFYTPVQIPVQQEGLYKIAFHSAPYCSRNLVEPCTNIYEEFISECGQIAAFDITVTDGSNNAHPGRAFTYLIYSKAAGTVLEPTDPCHTKNLYYYILADGYVYKITYPDMLGAFQVFLANKRGIVDFTSDNTIHHSIHDDDTDKFGITNTENDEFYKIFFSNPSQDILSYLGEDEIKSPEISNFKFIGETGNTSSVSKGGYFSFESTENIGTYQIDVVFEGGEKISLSNSIIKGTNIIHWDGMNSDGTPVSAENGINSGTAYLNIMHGENHTIFYDIEKNPGGIIIQPIIPQKLLTGILSRHILTGRTNQ